VTTQSWTVPRSLYLARCPRRYQRLTQSFSPGGFFLTGAIICAVGPSQNFSPVMGRSETIRKPMGGARPGHLQRFSDPGGMRNAAPARLGAPTLWIENFVLSLRGHFVSRRTDSAFTLCIIKRLDWSSFPVAPRRKVATHKNRRRERTPGRVGKREDRVAFRYVRQTRMAHKRARQSPAFSIRERNGDGLDAASRTSNRKR